MRKGISLVEIVVASVVLAVMAVPLISMTFSSKRNEQQSSLRLEALLVAQGALEEALHNCDRYKTTLPRKIPSYPAHLRVYPSILNAKEEKLIQIVVKVEFSETGKTQSLEVSGFCSLFPENYEIR
jgi:type II secretory pathway pseudopilin PulG